MTVKFENKIMNPWILNEPFLDPASLFEPSETQTQTIFIDHFWAR